MLCVGMWHFPAAGLPLWFLPPSGCAPRAGFLAGDLPLVAQKGISAHKKGVLGVWEQIHPSLRTGTLKRRGFLTFLVFPPPSFVSL